MLVEERHEEGMSVDKEGAFTAYDDQGNNGEG
jgi:hypothetical protein